MALTSTNCETGSRSATSGALKPAIDWATTTTSPGGAAATIASAYSASPADSSAAGSSTATAVWPRSCSSGTTRCQYQAWPPAPGTSRNVVMLLI